MRKVSMATRAELILAIRDRYASAGRPEKAKILDEFVALTGFSSQTCDAAAEGER
jgi:hypothetical protein